jgi:transglutaminase-like putative cysteine protease
MSATLERPTSTPAEQATAESPRPSPSPGSRPPDNSLLIEAAVLMLITAAALPLGRVFTTGAWIRPTAGVVLVTLGVAAVARRARLAFWVSLLIGLAAFFLYLGVVLVPATLLLGVVPTPSSLAALWSLAAEGLAIIPERASPTAVVPPLALLAVGGTGLIALIADLLVHTGRAPLKAVVVALTLWAVPLSMSAPRASLWGLSVPVLAATALLLLAFAGTDSARWGRWIYSRDRQTSRGAARRGGLVISVGAIVAGVVLAATLPGYGQPAWWKLRGEGGSTLTANPIVQLRSNLVASGNEPIFTVSTPRPVYLRTTALDVYGASEEWTTSGITTRPLRDGVMARGTSPDAFDVDVTVGDISRADLVPMPFQPLRVGGEVSESFQFDPRTGTVALDAGESIETGDTYSVLTAVPRPSPEQLDAAAQRMPGDALTRLPDDTPAEVASLAEEIVGEAEASTPFQQALAIQNELRSWEYSLEPPQGHDGTAMTRFLENRIGYCEQFAGTMAVMLRTLDIPSRVAVGFTPGRLVSEGSDTYAVSWSNSHAWVEVLFPDIGWIAFEPTPRGDGNVLVPSSGDPSPVALEERATPLTGIPEGPYADGLAQPGDDLPRAGQFQPGIGGAFSPDGATDGSGSPLAAVAAVLGLLALGACAVAWRRTTAEPSRDAPAAERVLASGRRVTRVGVGLRVPPQASETDREYLRRLVVGTTAHDAGARLALALTRARYARAVDVEDAAQAQRAASEIVAALIGSMSRPRRFAVTARGTVSELLTAASRWPGPARLRGRSAQA